MYAHLSAKRARSHIYFLDGSDGRSTASSGSGSEYRQLSAAETESMNKKLMVKPNLNGVPYFIWFVFIFFVFRKAVWLSFQRNVVNGCFFVWTLAIISFLLPNSQFISFWLSPLFNVFELDYDFINLFKLDELISLSLLFDILFDFLHPTYVCWFF